MNAIAIKHSPLTVSPTVIPTEKANSLPDLPAEQPGPLSAIPATVAAVKAATVPAADFRGLPTFPTELIVAALRVPGYDRPPVAPSEPYNNAVDGVLTTLAPKLDAMKEQGVISAYDFSDKSFTMHGLVTIEALAKGTNAHHDALRGLTEIKELFNSGWREDMVADQSSSILSAG